ncbi:MAG: choice-of-anchor Q domain-containing protein [bacterium]
MYVIDAEFASNEAAFGGGLSIRLGSAVVSNAVFVGNAATADGGAVAMVSAAAMTLTNGSICGNTASRYGGAISTINTDPILTNVILWGNSAGTAGDEIYNQTGGAPDISYSIIQGSGGSGAGWDTSLGTDGGNNLDSDPLFVDPLTGNLRLLAGSPAIDHGSNAAPELQSTDLDGNTRILGGVVDMGAYEFDPATGVGDAPQLAIGLAQNYPNPFNPETVIRYTLPAPADQVDLVVYSVRGEQVCRLVAGPCNAGPDVVTWAGRNDNGEEVGSGVYFYRLHTEWGTVTRRMVLLR